MSMPKKPKKGVQETLILVDPNDRKIGEIEKLKAHQYAMLHRAFSIIIFRKRKGQIELLLQQRHPDKYHGGGLWSNACCSHPHPGENLKASALKRLKEEIGIEAKLKKIGKFHYIAHFDNGLYENEIDHVFVGTYDVDDEIPINKMEVLHYAWQRVASLKKDLAQNPKKYTPWLKSLLELASPVLRHLPA
jgi:isopentenyl-diphosphate delta-isomerase type 1